jgi:hypothetical protein
MKVIMYKILVGLLAIVLVSGCGAPPTEIVGSNQWNAANYNPEVPANLEGKTWISPGVVEIANMYPGAEAEWVVKIHNGNSEPTPFSVSYRIPNNTRTGYFMPPSSAQIWITISQSYIVLQPGETKDILVNLKIPNGAPNIPNQWEFWTVVTEKSGGMVETEMATRWLVKMR